MRSVNAVLTIAYRDFIKLTRDRARIIATFIFPVIFIGVLGTSLQANLGAQAGYNLLLFTFTGVLGQTLFQSTSSGVISLVEDRENDFSQELFVSPVSRYAIIIGKILGETSVALIQVVAIIAFGYIMRIDISLMRILALFPFAVLVCFMAGAFGVLVLSRLNSQRAVNQVFPFIILPQFFLAGVFSPIKDLPPYLLILSRLAPMTYAVDLLRSIYYAGTPDYSKVVLFPWYVDTFIVSTLFLVFLFFGTFLFIQNERNR